MSKHTPGPWSWSYAGPIMRDNYSQHFAIAQLGQANLIAGVFRDVRGGLDVAKANAALIAAAPELLEGLYGAEIAVSELCQGQHPENECWAILGRIRAAIAKAEGRS